LAALSLYPERNETLDKYVSKKRSAAADLIIPYLQDVSPDIRENFLRMMSDGRAGALSMSEKNIAVLVKMLIEAMDTNPGLAAEFIRKRVGKKVETWVKDGVEGANTLVSRLAHRMRQGEFVSEGAGMPDLDLF
jgi:nitrate reductase alpha subunit